MTVIKELEVTCVPCGVPNLVFDVVNEGINVCQRFQCLDGINPALLNPSSACPNTECDGACVQMYNVLGGNTIWDFTLTSNIPVTWIVTHEVLSQAPNCTIVSQSPTEIRFHVLGTNSSTGAVPPWNINCNASTPNTEKKCGLCYINFLMRVKAVDACGNTVIDRLFSKRINS